MLSNNHVVAGVNTAQKGAAVVLQPGEIDGGSDPKDKIGHLYDFYPIDLNGGENEIDAALVELRSHPEIKRRRRIIVSNQGTPAQRFQSLSRSERRAQPGMVVRKSGRTTGHTMGTVDLVDVSIVINFPGHGRANFVNQFRVTDADGTFSAAGDSGSLVTTQGFQPLGLLFAGTTGGNQAFTFCNDIRTVLDALKIKIDY
jgi:hypothetical protein